MYVFMLTSIQVRAFLWVWLRQFNIAEAGFLDIIANAVIYKYFTVDFLIV